MQVAVRRALTSTVVWSFLALLFPSLASAASDIRSERVRFAKGANSAAVEGTLRGDQTVDYVLGAAKGQTMNVSLGTKHSATYFNLIAPGEEDVAFFIGSTSGKQFEGVLPATGDYRIRVYMMRSAARRNETANYRLEMIVSGPTHGSASHDAVVPGTSFHATAKIRCVATPDEPMGQCDAGVKRTAGGGTVYVTTPGGGSRVITFRDGSVTATDANTPFEVERRDEWSVVRIGTVEVYEIPDALVHGG